jgi:hypothetical protein
MGLMTDYLWDISRWGTAKLDIDWGGYQVSLRLPINPDEAHRSDRMVMVDTPLLAWGETKPSCNRASRPLKVGGASRK